MQLRFVSGHAFTAVPYPKAGVLKLCRVLDGAEPRHHTSSFSAKL
jgi:hypothetical protein